ncbi:polysaccharide biosynthesis protein [Heyndrickxia oleronia]|uniref:Nucleoside-diphosphate sugar epimerase/dehydratase n=1 Tax=Heyndrickxia oleronia TaxID=38875 RepID=A0AAW6SR85_9BACI|nr:nucleoside-diphosphate sugar epimerase/dehydratase [Heyndrickxia oleronia]MDH5159337.1 nucleoside-diphosphate sugar epimerase/dehydratase [Heyndrickxia oleronia]
MTYQQRISLFLLIDTIIVLTAIFIGCFLVYESFNVINFPIVLSCIAILTSHYFFSFHFHLYKKSWEYASIGELVIILKTVTASIIISAIVQGMIIGEIFYRLLVVTCLLHMILIGGSRFCWRVYRDRYLVKDLNKKRTLIIGAGSAGTMVVRQLLKRNDSELLPIAFIDDNRNKHHLDILGIPVIGSVSNITNIVSRLNIDHIIIAIPSLKKQELNTIFQECAKTDAKTQILPRLEDLLVGNISVSKLRDVKVEDLLGRETVELDIEGISEHISNKVILVTGAGGSIGSEICRQIATFHPKKLILLGHGENSIYNIEMELKETYKQSIIDIIPVIADIQDIKTMYSVMDTYRPNVVYHAAAHKHVPLMEANPEEAVKNNIVGTMNAANASKWAKVETFVMISSDKAVKPTNVMGATKRLAEMVIQHMNRDCETKFVAVRFGNVLGSRGSVVPLFKKQIEKGGPVTVTHPEMTRYFMTIPEASRLVLQAGALANWGQIFVLDMGDPVKIVDLAKNLIRLSGFTVDDIGIQYSGIRPGEKLFEELLDYNEIHEEQIYPNIYIGKTKEIYINEIEDIISNLTVLDKETLKRRLIDLANHQHVTQSLIQYSG